MFNFDEKYKSYLKQYNFIRNNNNGDDNYVDDEEIMILKFIHTNKVKAYTSINTNTNISLLHNKFKIS